jgi:hypothetical protein
MMKLLIASLLFSCSEAFVSPRLAQQQQTFALFSTEEPQKAATQAPMEPGSHEELMYTLGVNLARQLGDIRPLVEDGDELAQLAKGLLDTVIGRLTEDAQKSLLASRGKDLNKLISERA